jgi:hypothetical protein
MSTAPEPQGSSLTDPTRATALAAVLALINPEVVYRHETFQGNAKLTVTMYLHRPTMRQFVVAVSNEPATHAVLGWEVFIPAHAGSDVARTLTGLQDFLDAPLG